MIGRSTHFGQQTGHLNSASQFTVFCNGKIKCFPILTAVAVCLIYTLPNTAFPKLAIQLKKEFSWQQY